MKVLFAEDDKKISEMVKEFLSSEKHSVQTADNGAEAVELFQKDSFDLVLLEYIRSVSVVPVIIVTAKDSDTDKMMGLNLGADDYITKPFSLVELLARMKANIRRATVYSTSESTQKKVIRYRDLSIHLSEYQVRREGKDLNLTHTEFEILKLLVTNQGRAFSKEQLYHAVWKEPYYGNENVLNTHMNRLRNKLSCGEEKKAYIRTLWGIGYKMEEE